MGNLFMLIPRKMETNVLKYLESLGPTVLLCQMLFKILSSKYVKIIKMGC